MRIIALTHIKSGVGYHRLVLPLVTMKQQIEGGGGRVLITNLCNDEILERGFDIMLINRNLSKYTMDEVQDWRKRYGFKLIVDNDDYWHLDADHNLFDHYRLNNLPDKLMEWMRIADGVTCTHDRLAYECGKLNSNVCILPNGLPYGEDQFADVKAPSEKIRLFWSGSDTHKQDLDILRGPMKRVLDYKPFVKVVMSGYSKGSHPVWQSMADAFTVGGKLEHLVYDFADPITYMHSYCDSDINFIPLRETRFNSMKSNLKVLEAAVKKNPAIVSNVHPYKDLPACMVNSQKDWNVHLRNLIKEAEYRKISGQILFDYCNTNFNIYNINKLRYDFYANQY